MEYRTCSLRATDITTDRVVKGVAVVYEAWQRVSAKGARAFAGSSRLREKIATGAIRLEDIPRIKALINHRQENYLASTDSGLKLENRDNTLRFELTLPRTTLGDDVIGLMEAERELPVSIGFVARGKNSNIKQIDFDDADLEELFDNPSESRATVEKVTPLDNTEINLQTGRLEGSDYVEGINVKTGRSWRVYKSLNIVEISLLQGLDPAWEGVYASADGVKRCKHQADIIQARAELEAICLDG